MSTSSVPKKWKISIRGVKLIYYQYEHTNVRILQCFHVSKLRKFASI